MTKKFLLIFLAAFLLTGVGFSSEMAQGADLAVDFSLEGLWHYDGSSWSLIDAGNAVWMADYNGDLAVVFDGGGPAGVKSYDGNNLTQIDNDTPYMMIAADDTVFGAYGDPWDNVWKYAGSWQELPLIGTGHPWQMIAVGEDVFLTYPGYGLYEYDDSGDTLTQIHTWEPEDMIAVGTDVMVDFGEGRGLYKYDGSWQKVANLSPEDMIAVGTDVMVDFGQYGMFKYDGGWQKVANLSPEGMIAVGTTAIVDFGQYGLFKYDGSFTKITPADAEKMAEFSGNVIVDFGGDNLYTFDLTTWTAISKPTYLDAVADHMIEF